MFRKPFPKTNDHAKLAYGKYQYDASHWAHHVPTTKDNYFIAILEIDHIQISLTLYPSDARGYRTIARLINPENMSSTFNRPYTIKEKITLNLATTVLSCVYEYHQLAVQIQLNGNNSQYLNSEGETQLGSDKEPSLLHVHLIGRGNPKTCYIGNVPLRGPEAGITFDGRGEGELEKGNRKVKWDEKEMKTVANALTETLYKTIEKYPEFQNIKVIHEKPIIKPIPT